MIHHATLGTDDLAAGGAFYDAVLRPLGLVRTWDNREQDGWLCWQPPGREPLGPQDQPGFWLCRPADGGPARAGNGATLAFQAPTRAAVRAFHAAALAQGGRCEGPPGLRPHYGVDYFAAYVRDPAGNKIAAVCRRPDVWWQDLEAFFFGSSPQMADQLAALTAIGVKRATAGAAGPSSPVSGPGQRWLVTDGAARPVCVIETVSVDIMPYAGIDAAFAADEGEGDGSLAYWRAVHEAYFRGEGVWDPAMQVEAERFVLVAVIEPPADPDAVRAEEARSAREVLGRLSPPA